MIRIIRIKDNPHVQYIAVLDIPNDERYILSHYPADLHFIHWVEGWRKRANSLNLPFEMDKETTLIYNNPSTE